MSTRGYKVRQGSGGSAAGGTRPDRDTRELGTYARFAILVPTLFFCFDSDGYYANCSYARDRARVATANGSRSWLAREISSGGVIVVCQTNF